MLKVPMSLPAPGWAPLSPAWTLTASRARLEPVPEEQEFQEVHAQEELTPALLRRRLLKHLAALPRPMLPVLPEED